jgi:hypothetical protein
MSSPRSYLIACRRHTQTRGENRAQREPHNHKAEFLAGAENVSVPGN